MSKLATVKKEELMQVCKAVRMGPNSIYLLIPSEIADRFHVQEGQEFLLYVNSQGRLIYEPKEIAR